MQHHGCSVKILADLVGCFEWIYLNRDTRKLEVWVTYMTRLTRALSATTRLSGFGVVRGAVAPLCIILAIGLTLHCALKT